MGMVKSGSGKLRVCLKSMRSGECTGLGWPARYTGNVNPLRAIVCCVIPPLGVLDRGPKAIVITTILTVLGWVPGVITALVLASQPKAA